MSEAEPKQDTPFEEPEPEVEPVEPEPDEAEEAPDEQPAPEPEPEPETTTPEDIERRYQKVEGSFKTYKASIDRNLEEFALNLIGCPLCYSTPHPAYVNKHDLGRVPDDVQDNVKMFLGYARETEYESAPGIVACTDCGGLGKVSTGSRVAEHMTITCPTCKGYGYVPPPGAGVLGAVAVGNGQSEEVDPRTDLETPDRDNWGEPRVLPDGTLNDNYGKQPQFKVRHPVYGETRLLQPEELVSG